MSEREWVKPSFIVIGMSIILYCVSWWFIHVGKWEKHLRGGRRTFLHLGIIWWVCSLIAEQSLSDYISGFIWAYITRIYKGHTGLKISALAKVIPKKMTAQNCILAVGRTVKNRFICLRECWYNIISTLEVVSSPHPYIFPDVSGMTLEIETGCRMSSI